MTALNKFVDLISQLGYQEESEFAVEGCQSLYVRRRFELTTLGKLPRYVGIYQREHISLDELSQISSHFYREIDLALGNEPEPNCPDLKSSWEAVKSESVLNSVAVDVEGKTTYLTKIFWAIPVVFAEMVDDDCREVLESTTVDHYSRMEFPVVFDMVNESAHYFQGSKIFGGLYYWKLKREVSQFFPAKPEPEAPPVEPSQDPTPVPADS